MSAIEQFNFEVGNCDDAPETTAYAYRRFKIIQEML